MITQMSVMDASGDLEMRWDHNNPEEVEAARAMVYGLKEKGYSFFLSDGRPADEVEFGAGALTYRRVEAEAILPPDSPPVAAVEAEAPESGGSTPKKRGRRRQATVERPADQTVVASRAMRGG